MKRQDMEQLKRVIVERARVFQRPTAEQIQRERLRGHRLARFVTLRLKQLNQTPEQLARHLDIEEDFVLVLIEGTFPVSELNAPLLGELASFLQCTVTDLRNVMLGVQHEILHGGERKTSPKSHDAVMDTFPKHDRQEAIDLDD